MPELKYRPLIPTSPLSYPLKYPGASPDRAWILASQGIAWLVDPQIIEPTGIAVLAIGSNRRPQRLAAHLGELKTPIYGIPIELHGADIVYPAHVASYGVVTATIIPAPAVIKTSLLFLNPEQLVHLAKQEFLGELFDLYKLRGTRALAPQLKTPIENPLAFVNRQGALPFKDQLPRRLWRVPALKTPIRRASLTSAHKRVGELLGESGLNWPLRPEVARNIDRSLLPYGLDISWDLKDQLNHGTKLNKSLIKELQL